MMNRLRSFAIALAVAAVAGASPLIAQDSGIPVGSKAPTRTLDDTDGKPVDLSKVIGTRPVLLEFWATWCPNCKALEPTLVAAHKKYGTSVAVYVVAVPINQNLARVQRYVREYKYAFPTLWDKDGLLAADYDVPATSYVVLIDRTGKIAYTGLGGDQDLEAAIKKVL